MASLTARISQALQQEFVEGIVYRIDLDHVDVAPNGSSGILRSLPLTGDRDKIKPGDPIKIITVAGERVALAGDIAFSDAEVFAPADASEIELMESLQGYAKGEITAQGQTDSGSSVATTTGFTNTQARDSFTATAGQKSYTLASTPVDGTVLVYWNGILQKYTTDYTVSGATVTTVFSPGAGDIIDAVYNTSTNILVNADMAVDDLSSQVPAQTFNTTYKFVGKSLAVYVNGILQEPSIITLGANLQSFTVSSARNIVAGDKVLAVYPKGSGFSVADADTLDGKHAADFYLKTDKVANAAQADSATTAANVAGYTPATSGANQHLVLTDGVGGLAISQNLNISGTIMTSTPLFGILSLVSGSIANNTTTSLLGVWTGIDQNGVALTANGFQVSNPGVYLVTASIYWGANANGSRELGLWKGANSWSGVKLAYDTRGASPNGYVSHSLTTIVKLAVNDTIYASVWQNCGGTLGIDTANPNYLKIVRIA